MNEQLQEKLVEIISSIQEAAKVAGDFAVDQLPDVVQSYVMYGRVTTVISSLFLLCIAGALFRLSWWAYKSPWNLSSYSFENGKKRSDSNIIVIGATGVFGCLFSIAAVQSFDWLVWVAPKVWLLKELASLAK